MYGPLWEPLIWNDAASKSGLGRELFWLYSRNPRDKQLTALHDPTPICLPLVPFLCCSGLSALNAYSASSGSLLSPAQFLQAIKISSVSATLGPRRCQKLWPFLPTLTMALTLALYRGWQKEEKEKNKEVVWRDTSTIIFSRGGTNVLGRWKQRKDRELTHGLEPSHCWN